MPCSQEFPTPSEHETTRSDTQRLRAAAYWMRTRNVQSAKEGIGDFEPCSIGAGNQFLLTKEVLGDLFAIGAPLRSNAEAFANNRCLAALPIFSHE